MQGENTQQLWFWKGVRKQKECLKESYSGKCLSVSWCKYWELESPVKQKKFFTSLCFAWRGKGIRTGISRERVLYKYLPLCMTVWEISWLLISQIHISTAYNILMKMIHFQIIRSWRLLQRKVVSLNPDLR